MKEQIIEAIKKIFPNANTSATALWRRLVDIFSSIVDIIYGDIEYTKDSLFEYGRSVRIMTKQYYIDKALAWQKGDSLVIIDDDTKQLGYKEIIPEHQIIKQAQVYFSEGQGLVINVAEEATDGGLQKLSSSDYDAFITYIGNFIPLGLNYQIQSEDPDILSFPDGLHVYYDSLTSLDELKSEIETEMDNLVKSSRIGEFLYSSVIEDAIESISGVESVSISRFRLTATNGAITTSSSGRARLYAGYFNIDKDVYSQQIKYIAV